MMRNIATAIFLLICLHVAIDETLGRDYDSDDSWGLGHGWHWVHRRRCTLVRNCQDCRGLKCTRCDRGYYKLRQLGGVYCVRRCPRELVPRNGLCTSRYLGCRYGLSGCKSCISRNSCEKCAPGFFGLERRVLGRRTKCVKRCPYNHKAEWDRRYGMSMCKYARSCRLVGNCLQCPDYRKCLSCDVGYVPKITKDKTDVTCKPVVKECKRHANCLSCPGYRSCVTCKLGYTPAVSPGNTSMICKKQQKADCPSIPNCAKCYLRISCDRCAAGYYSYRARLQIGAKCVRRCPSGYEARNDTFWPTCKRIPRRRNCLLIPNCEKCPNYWTCSQCRQGHALYKGLVRSQCVIHCPRTHQKVLKLDNKTLECREIAPKECTAQPNCAECPRRWRCKRCDPGFVLYKRTHWSECLKRCPRLYEPVLDAESKTLVCKYKPVPKRCGPICAMYCRYGFVKDKNGCPICKCVAPPSNACNLKPCSHPHATCRERNGATECVCDRLCDRMYDPVCGSDGKTYNSECMMKLLTCERDVVVTVAYQGECVSDVKYHLQTQPAQSCHDVCRSHNLVCVAENHGFSNDNVQELFEEVGVSCKPGDNASDLYQWDDNPCYIKASAFKSEKWAGRCIGWKNIPSKIDCSGVPPRPTIQRLCPCKTDLGATPEPTTEPETPYTTPEKRSVEPEPTTESEPTAESEPITERSTAEPEPETDALPTPEEP